MKQSKLNKKIKNKNSLMIRDKIPEKTNYLDNKIYSKLAEAEEEMINSNKRYTSEEILKSIKKILE